MKVNRPTASAPPSPTAPTARGAPASPAASAPAPVSPQRTQAAGPTAPPPVTDALSTTSRPSARAGGVNLSGTTAPPPAPPLPPRSAATPTSGQPPRGVNASLQEELERASLKQASHGVVHPDLPGIRTQRHPFSEPHEFADFTRDARASTHRLMENPTGNQMLTDLNNSTGRLNPGATGTPQKPLTAVDIQSANRMNHHPRVPSGASDAEKLAAASPAYRSDGKPGAGAASTVQYNPNAGRSDPRDVALRPGDFRANSLGHEMVHAHRASQGTQVAPLEASKHAQNPTLNKFDSPTPGGENYPKQIISTHARLKEEFETVGLQRTPGQPDAPTENKIRKELGMPPRKDYSGEVPGGANHQELQQVNQALDNRLRVSKQFNLTEPPVTKIVNHLEK